MLGENRFTRVTMGKLIKQSSHKIQACWFYGYSPASTLNIYKATNQQN